MSCGFLTQANFQAARWRAKDTPAVARAAREPDLTDTRLQNRVGSEAGILAERRLRGLGVAHFDRAGRRVVHPHVELRAAVEIEAVVMSWAGKNGPQRDCRTDSRGRAKASDPAFPLPFSLLHMSRTKYLR